MQKIAWKFGELEKVATDEGFIWYVELALKSKSFGEVPFYLVSADTADVDDAGSCSRSARPRYRSVRKRRSCLPARRA
ncbi:hypothetical protein [uncultured Campylobacter sp.]|uniref:hypothetical protein n=1 Tax=uncultured Campylobacter sp. TaxID=218934 RepID=UPI0026362128|nr:hypothetical protein [uncultured Campylobacter sp.]